MANAVAPLVPPDVLLTDFPHMPLHIERLRKSRAWLICRRRPELAFYLLNLWMRAWHERPAASIENDDDVLADAAGCPPDKWSAIKEDVIRGWILCTDGRLYHPIIAELALEAWGKRLMFRWNKECARVRKENQRRKEAGESLLPMPEKPGVHVMSQGQAGDVTGTTASVPVTPEPVAATSAKVTRKRSDVTRKTKKGSAPSQGHHAENALKGEDKGEGKGDSSVSKDTGAKAPTVRLFGAGVDWLQSVTGKSNAQCRTMIGGWRKLLGGPSHDAELAALLAEAQAQNIEGPESWFPAAIRERKSRAADQPPTTYAEAVAQRERDPAWQGVQ